MIDLSDGLAGDLRHLMRASGTGAELLAEAIPISPEAQREGGESASPRGEARSPLTAALTDGEDFELLFAVGGEMAAPLQNAWRERFPHLRLSRIGKLTAQGGLRLCDRFGARLLEAHGYTHFA
jgi:thiamine-monophosphate kinase